MAKLEDVKRQEAQVRQTKASNQNPQQRLDELDKRLGKGVGAEKERKRLHRLIDAASE